MEAQRPGDVLVVEADEQFRANAEWALKERGHNVVVCETGAAARAQLDRMAFEVVVCGRSLPDEDGYGLCHHIKTAYGYHGIVVLLVYGPSGVGQSAQPAESEPPDDWMALSAAPGELVSRVGLLMRMSRYQQEIHNAIRALMVMAEGVEEQDKRSRGHCQRLAIMAVELGAVLGCDEWQLVMLDRAAYLHDIGKVAIPGAILDKTQALSPREMEIVKEHCVLGVRLCSGVAALKPVLPIIRHHHERADGSGYPDRLRADETPILAQVFTIVDIYEALRVWRPYRLPMPEGQAIQIMSDEVSRGFWNRHVFEAFVEYILPGLEERLDAAHMLWVPH